MTIAASNRLADLAGRIRDAEAERASSSLAAAERTLEAGRLLLEAKEACRHGDWLPFLDLAGIAERQAQRLMLLVRAGLKSVTVSEIGMRAALDLAAKRRLPEAGEVLALSLGNGEGDDAGGEAGSAEAEPARQVLIWRASEPAEHFHMLGWKDAGSAVSAETVALRRPIFGETPEHVFAAADMILGTQAVTIERLGDAAFGVARQLHLDAMAEQVKP